VIEGEFLFVVAKGFCGSFKGFGMRYLAVVVGVLLLLFFLSFFYAVTFVVP